MTSLECCSSNSFVSFSRCTTYLWDQQNKCHKRFTHGACRMHACIAYNLRKDMSVWVFPCCPNIVIFPIKRNNRISVVHHISYGNECVVNFHSVHCRALLRIPTWVCLYFIYSGHGLCWCRAFSATDGHEFIKYTTMLNVACDKCIVSNVQMSNIYRQVF